MKKKFNLGLGIAIVAVLVLGLTLFAIYNNSSKNNTSTVTITTDRDYYMSAMSSARGIKMTPNFQSKKKYTKLEYHWITSEGEFEGEFSSDFIHFKDVNNQGETVLWSAVENNRVVDIKNPFDITLEVRDSESQKIIANTKLTITPDRGTYKIKK